MTFPAVSAGSAEAKMLHLLSFLFFLTLFAGAVSLILRELRGSAGAIAAALTRAPMPAAARPWPARVRLVSAPRPVVRQQALRALA